MHLLILGLILWTGFHLIPALPTWRDGLTARIGEFPRKGLVAIGLILSIFLMVRGWKAAGPGIPFWDLPPWFAHVAIILMLPAIILFLAPNIPNNLRRVFRHPQLIGFSLWALLHLVINADLRSVLLFGGLLAWAQVQSHLTNRRDGAWAKPPPVTGPVRFIIFAAGLIVWVLLIWLHPWLAGVSPMGA